MEAWVSKLGGMEEVRVIREGVASLEGGFAQGLAGDGASMRATLDVEAQSFSLNLCVNEAENLPKMDTVGRIDAYVVVMDTSGRKHRTPTIKNQYHPKWNYDVSFLLLIFIVNPILDDFFFDINCVYSLDSNRCDNR